MGILKKKPRGKPFQKGYDERRNIEGAPLRGESHAEVYSKLMNMTAEDNADYFGRDNEIGKAFAKMPKGVPVKMILAGRNLIAEIFEPSTGRMQMIMERTEGKIVQPITGVGENGAIEHVITVRREETKKPDGQ